MKDLIYKKMIYRFNILKDKINFGLELNDLDKKLIDILDEFNFLVDEIDEEQNKRIKKNEIKELLERFINDNF